jgi:hypothetical protein
MTSKQRAHDNHCPQSADLTFWPREERPRLIHFLLRLLSAQYLENNGTGRGLPWCVTPSAV